MENIGRRDFVRRAAVGSIALVSAPALVNAIAGTARADGGRGYYFQSLSAGPTVGSVVHRMIMGGCGSVSADEVSGGGTFLHFDNATAVPRTILGTGTWRARKLTAFDVIGTYGELVAGIMEADVRLRPVSGGSVPASLKVVCNIGPAGLINTGEHEGFILTVGGLTFEPLSPEVGLTVFTNRPPFD